MRDRSLNASYLERKLRAIGLTGSAPLADLADVQGLLVLENDRVEWGAPAGEFIQGGFVFAGAGGAGNLSVVGVLNPANSGVLCITKRWWGDTDPGTPVNGTTIAIEVVTGTQPPAGGKQNRDLRVVSALGGGPVMCSSTNQTPAALFLTTLALFKPSVESYREPIVIPPGFCVVMSGVDAAGARRTNLAIEGTVDWVVRPFEGSWEIK